jgi:Asp-tRNA(Asn)/Glu-tRNA(Gln) amidotransferase B subunit
LPDNLEDARENHAFRREFHALLAFTLARAVQSSLKGQVMKLSKGKANPALVGEILERKLKS